MELHPSITQTIAYLGIASGDVKITAISTNCDSGGATGNQAKQTCSI